MCPRFHASLPFACRALDPEICPCVRDRAVGAQGDVDGACPLETEASRGNVSMMHVFVHDGIEERDKKVE